MCIAGCVIVLFFQCMGAFLSPVNRTEGFVKWGLLAHTITMFTAVTIYTAINLHLQSISYIENRDFPGADELPPGPMGYQYFIYFKPICVVATAMFVLNNWLADALMVSFMEKSIPKMSDLAGCSSSIVAT